MKRTYLIICLLGLMTTNMAAQGFGIKGGFYQTQERYRIGSHNKATKKGDNLRNFHKYPNAGTYGLNVGMFYEYDIPGAKGFGFGLGVDGQFVTDRDRKKSTEGSYVVTHDTLRTQHTLAFPVYLSYRLRIAKEAAFLFQTGPKFNYGLVNKVQIRTTYEDKSMAGKNTDITFNRYSACATDETRDANTWPGIAAISSSTLGNQYLDYHSKRFNTQWMATFGVQYQRMAIRFTYAWGLQNLFTTRRVSNKSVSYRLYDRMDDWSVDFSYYITKQKKK